MKKLCLFLFLFCLGSVTAHGADTITMTTAGQISCPSAGTAPASTTIHLTSWSWGSSDTTTASGAAGKVVLSQISLSKPFDACTARMLDLYFLGTSLGTVTIEQLAPNGASAPAPLAELTLTNAVFASYGVGGSTTAAAAENWTLSFDKICVTTYGVSPTGQSQAGTTICYGGSSSAASEYGASWPLSGSGYLQNRINRTGL
jgi:type VI protein secretion system component Hcp